MTLFKKQNFTWNYRILEKTYEMTSIQKEDYIKSMKNIFGNDYNPSLEPDIIYEIIEVYYDTNDNITAWSESSIVPWRKF